MEIRSGHFTFARQVVYLYWEAIVVVILPDYEINEILHENDRLIVYEDTR